MTDLAEKVLQRFLTAAQLPSRVDSSVVKLLQNDFKRIIKIYRDIPTKLDTDPETYQQTYAHGEQWDEARSLILKFRANLEGWIYKTLIQHSKQDKDSWAQRAVREKGWTFLIGLGGAMFPTQWDSRTNTHIRAPWELEKKRESNIARLQRNFREFIASIEQLIETEGGAIERLPATEQFQVAGINVVVHNIDRSQEHTDYEEFLRDLDRQTALIIRAGFRKALQGLTMHVKFESSNLVAGEYSPDRDEITIFSLGQFAGHNHTTFIHEVGHRYYFRVLSSQARQHWVETMQSQTVTIDSKAVDEFMAKVWSDRMDRDDLLRKIERMGLDPETEAKFRALSEHTPGYTNSKEEVSAHHHKFNVGDKANIEHISDYGAENPVEAFAEAFQIYVRKGPQALGPWTRYFFESITRSGRLASMALRVAARYKDKKESEAGNMIYMYSERQVANRNKKKAERIQKLSKSIKKLRTQVKKDLKSDDPETKLTALAVALMDHTYERVGNNESAKEGHYGVTGWLRKHVSFGKDSATIKYVGKSGVKQNKKVTDPVIRKALKDAYDSLDGDDSCILSWKDGCVTAEKVNSYLKPFDATAKDIRGFHANEEMRTRLKVVRKGTLPEDKKEREKQLKEEFKEALDETAKAVGHEASTLKSQYLVPGLEEAFLKDGTIIDKLGSAHEDKVPGGLADKKNPGDFNPQQLAKGVEIEMEHTDDESVAQEIAMDHLTEDPNYYKKLRLVEKT